MVKQGVYCSLKQRETVDVHAGVSLVETSYYHICFFHPESKVGFYSGDRLWFKPFIDQSYRYSGEITEVSDNRIEFYINDPYNKDTILFSGSCDGELLNIVARRTSDIDKVWLLGSFEYIGNGEV